MAEDSQTYFEGDHVVSVVQFNYDDLDSVEDIIREHVAHNRPVLPIINSMIQDSVRAELGRVLPRIFSFIWQAKKPRLVCNQIAWATNMLGGSERSISDYAREAGISKQAFKQGAQRICRDLNLRQTRTMRDDAARDKMRKSNYRHRSK